MAVVALATTIAAVVLELFEASRAQLEESGVRRPILRDPDQRLRGCIETRENAVTIQYIMHSIILSECVLHVILVLPMKFMTALLFKNVSS